MKRIDLLVQIIYILTILSIFALLGYFTEPLWIVLGVIVALASMVATVYRHKKLKEWANERLHNDVFTKVAEDGKENDNTKACE